MRLNVLNGRIERRQSLLKELEFSGIDDYELWDSLHDRNSVVKTINQSHKQIVEYAQVAGFNETFICEDDIRFTHHNSWNYFVSQRPKEYDLWLGMIYMGWPDEKGIVKDFTGLTIYSVHSRFYDTFLSVPLDEHLDRALSGKGEFHLCQPFVAIQANGFSSNTGKIECYDQLLKGRNFYLGY